MMWMEECLLRSVSRIIADPRTKKPSSEDLASTWPQTVCQPVNHETVETQNRRRQDGRENECGGAGAVPCEDDEYSLAVQNVRAALGLTTQKQMRF